MLTIEQINRMRLHIITVYSEHCLSCPLCQQVRECAENKRLMALLRKYSWLSIEMQQV
jgi:hypothetical protein